MGMIAATILDVTYCSLFSILSSPIPCPALPSYPTLLSHLFTLPYSSPYLFVTHFYSFISPPSFILTHSFLYLYLPLSTLISLSSLSLSRHWQSCDGSSGALSLRGVLRRRVLGGSALSGHWPPQDIHRQSETKDAEKGERHEYVCVCRDI